MAIALKSKKYDITIDSNTIIGVMGNNYEEFIKAFRGDNVYYLGYEKDPVLDIIEVDNSLDIDIESILNKNRNELSHSDKRLLQYTLMVQSNPRIIIINEPYLYLDNKNKKKISLLFNKLIKQGKTIIVGSNDTNVIYSLCKKVLLINKRSVYYDNVEILSDKKIINRYHLNMPEILIFINEAKKKKINLPYSKDIRDLIKDVYRNVSKK